MDLTQRTPRWWEGWQDILNAQPVPPRGRQHDVADIPVRARIHWAHDGVERVDTVAFATSGRLVLVLMPDARSHFRGVWLDRDDVERLPTR